MGMAAVIHRKGPPENFMWEEIQVGSPARGQVRLRSTAVGVNFADTYHRAGIPHPMIVGDPPVVLGFEGVGTIEELGPGVTGLSVGPIDDLKFYPVAFWLQILFPEFEKLLRQAGERFLPARLLLIDGAATVGEKAVRKTADLKK